MKTHVSLVVACALATSSVARADAPAQDVAAAQALFDEAKALMDAGKHDAACPKLVESQRLDPGGGTLLLIALCHEAQGKTATAWADFGAALSQASTDGRQDRADAASEHVRALAPRIMRAQIVLTSEVSGLEIRQDGAVIPESAWARPFAVDPGEHTYEARAPGKEPWRQAVPFAREGATLTVAVPALDDAKPVAPPAVVRAPDREEAPPEGSRTAWIAIAGGTGLVAAGVGTAFGLSASAKWNEAERACPGHACTNPADADLERTAGARADLSTAFFVVAGVGLATAGVLWLTAPSSSSRGLRVTPAAGPSGGGVWLGGTL